MDIEFFPSIAPDDYAAFRRLLGEDIPNTYDEWRNLQTNEIRQFRQVGRNTREVPVDPNEFAAFLQTTGAQANLTSLRNFTIAVVRNRH